MPPLQKKRRTDDVSTSSARSSPAPEDSEFRHLSSEHYERRIRELEHQLEARRVVHQNDVASFTTSRAEWEAEKREFQVRSLALERVAAEVKEWEEKEKERERERREKEKGWVARKDVEAIVKKTSDKRDEEWKDYMERIRKSHEKIKAALERQLEEAQMVHEPSSSSGNFIDLRGSSEPGDLSSNTASQSEVDVRSQLEREGISQPELSTTQVTAVNQDIDVHHQPTVDQNYIDADQVISLLLNLNAKVAVVCANLANNLTDHFNSSGILSSLIFEDKLPARIIPVSLIRTAEHKPRSLNRFLTVLLRFHISYKLFDDLDRFHPTVHTKEGAGFLEDWLDKLRYLEPQASVGRWRAWTYKVFEPPETTLDERALKWGQHFLNHTLEQIIKPLVSVLEPSSVIATASAPSPPNSRSNFVPSESITASLVDLGRDAYLWSFDARTACLTHDFTPMLFKCNQPYNSNEMQPDGAVKLKNNPLVVACVGLGLKSSVAVGGEREPDERWEIKVPVVTEEYFSLSGRLS